MSKKVIFLAVLLTVFCATSLFAQDETAPKRIYIKAQAGSPAIKNLGYVDITVPKASLKIMCEDERGNVISTFVLPATVYNPEEE